MDDRPFFTALTIGITALITAIFFGLAAREAGQGKGYQQCVEDFGLAKTRPHTKGE